MMEAVRTSETSVDSHFTRQYIPEDNSDHHTRRRENLKSHIDLATRHVDRRSGEEYDFPIMCSHCAHSAQNTLQGRLFLKLRHRAATFRHSSKELCQSVAPYKNYLRGKGKQYVMKAGFI
jgi:hypothetical protein